MTCAQCVEREGTIGDWDLEEEYSDEEHEREMGGRIGDLDLEDPIVFEEDREFEIIPPQDTRVLVMKTTDAPFR